MILIPERRVDHDSHAAFRARIYSSGYFSFLEEKDNANKRTHRQGAAADKQAGQGGVREF